MKSIDRLLLGHVLVALVAITPFTIIYAKPLSVIALHSLIIVSLYFSAFSLSRLTKAKFRYFSTTIFTILSSILLFLYAANFLSNAFWHDNVSLGFIVTYLSNLSSLLEEVPFALEIIIGSFVGITLAIFWLYNRYVSYLHSYDGSYSYKDSPVYLFITVITPIYFFFSFTSTDEGLWEGEPIASLALRANSISYLVDATQKISFGDSVSSEVNRNLQNVIIIHADALRADHMASYGYERETTPYISSLLAAGGEQIDMGLSICSESVCGILAALGSRHFSLVDAQTPLLNGYLKQAGYRTVFAGAGELSWGKLDIAFSHDIDYFARADLDQNFSIHDDNIIPAAMSQMPDYEGIPTFFFLHFISSHPTGRHYSQYQKYTPAKKSLLSYIFPSLEDPEILINAYDNSIIQLDALVEKSLRLLGEKGYMENSLVVIYSDHGEAFSEHGYFGHYHSLHQEEIWVPIIFISSQNRPLRETGFATLNDILPTVLDMTELPLPDDIEGVSLLRSSGDRISYHDSRTGIYAAVEKQDLSIYKLMFNQSTEETLLYNLAQDPAGLVDIHADEPVRSQQLLAKLKSHFALSQ